MELLNEDGKAMKNSRVLLVGLAYKKNTGDIREAPSLRIAELIRGYGAIVSAVDDHVESYRWPESITKSDLTAESVANADVVLLITDHDEFDLDVLAASDTPVLDTKNRVRSPNVRIL